MLTDTQAGTSPHLGGGATSSLEALALRAIRRYGEMAVSSVEGDAMALFLDYGNEIIDDILGHPYFPVGGVLPYYTHVSERRDIPDHILVQGLLAKHAKQQKSGKADEYLGDYFAKLNQVMARVKFGAAPEFEFQALDVPSGP